MSRRPGRMSDVEKRIHERLDEIDSMTGAFRIQLESLEAERTRYMELLGLGPKPVMVTPTQTAATEPAKPVRRGRPRKAQSDGVQASAIAGKCADCDGIELTRNRKTGELQCANDKCSSLQVTAT